MSNHRLRLLATTCLVFSAPVLAMPAFAQAADPAAVQGEILVTSSPLRNVESDLPQGVTVLDADQIALLPTGGLGDALDVVPGVASTRFGAGASRPVIRGLGEDRIRVLSSGLGQIDVSTLSPDHAIPSDALEGETVEILRGPAALAFGGNAIGGVVNVLDQRVPSIRPDDGIDARALAQVSSVDDGTQLAGSARADIGGGLVFGLGVRWRDADPYRIPGRARSDRFIADEPLEEGEEAAGRAPNQFVESLGWNAGVSWIGDRGFIGVGYHRFETDYGLVPSKKEEEEDADGQSPQRIGAFGLMAGKDDGPPVVLAGGGEPAPAGTPGGRIELEQDRWEARGEWFLGQSLIETASFALARADYVHSELEPDGAVGVRFDNTGTEARFELRQAGLFENRLTGAWGISGFETDVLAEGEEAFLPSTRTRDIGAFVVQRWDEGSHGFEGGARLETREVVSLGRTRDFDLVSLSGSGFLRPGSGWFLSATVSRTERGPTDIELFADGPHLATRTFEIGDPDLREEVGLSLEALARWRGERGRVELAVYDTRISGFIGLLPDGTEEDELPVFRFVQEDARFLGYELMLGWTALADGEGPAGIGLSLDATVDAVRAEFRNAGNVPRIPPLTITAGADATLGAFGGRFELVRTDAQDRLADFERPTAGFTFLNARLTWSPADTGFTLALDGRNLTDEEGRVATSFLKDDLPLPGRDVRLTLLQRF